MFTRVFVDNYKPLVNFDLALGRQNLLLGPNGGGKTAFFEVIDLLRHLLMGATLALPADSLTRWQALDAQKFEIDAQLGENRYLYKLRVEHHRDREKCRIAKESLEMNGERALFSADDGKAQLFRDDGSKGPEVLSDPTRSSLPIVAGRRDNKQLTRFVEWMTRDVVLCRLNPALMGSLSEDDAAVLQSNLANFASWWRQVDDEDANARDALRELVGPILPGFRGLELRKVSDRAKRLTARFGDRAYGFDELSDGQRVLIGLYALLTTARSRPMTLLLDEPDNFVAIREIQPFFNALEGCDHLQAIIISHHPTWMNLMAAESGLLFRRGVNAPTRVEPLRAPETTSLTASELMAQGYFDEPA